LFQDCSWPRKNALETPHMTARHKFRPSVNLHEFDSLQGSSDPCNATGATSSMVMRANLQQNNCSICRYARLESQSHLIPGSIHSRWHSGSRGYLVSPPFKKCFRTVLITAAHSNSLASPKLAKTLSTA